MQWPQKHSNSDGWDLQNQEEPVSINRGEITRIILEIFKDLYL